MEVLTNLISNSTLPQWAVLILASFGVYYLKKMYNTFEKMQGDISEIKTTIVEHNVTFEDHHERISKLENKVYEL